MFNKLNMPLIKIFEVCQIFLDVWESLKKKSSDIMEGWKYKYKFTEKKEKGTCKHNFPQSQAKNPSSSNRSEFSRL